MNKITEKILAEKNLGIIVYDVGLGIVQSSPMARDMLRFMGPLEQGAALMDLFPELIGNESVIGSIASGKSDPFRLDYINRVDANGEIIYLNLIVLPDDPAGNGLVIVEDATDYAKMQRQINQQKYDLLLYKKEIQYQEHHLAGTILGDSPPIQSVRKIVHQLSKVPMATVLLLGESGTGKSLTARVIHYTSMPSTAPFVEINCAALPENLIESELFGYEKGAFTHATTSRPGLLQAAENGTIFLDEIGEMPVNLQVKLLSVLETKKYRRLGSNREIDVHARIIAATNRDLEKAVSENRFREDLFYRLNVVTLTLPPLRTLGNDILIIADHLLKNSNLELKKNVAGFSPAARQAMLRHPWPGNVRELGNMIERAMIFNDSGMIDEGELVFFIPKKQLASQKWSVPQEGIVIEEVERQLIESAMAIAGGNKSKAARLLGLSRDTLRYRLEKHDVQQAAPATEPSGE